jgi:hypothetical protein
MNDGVGAEDWVLGFVPHDKREEYLKWLETN